MTRANSFRAFKRGDLSMVALCVFCVVPMMVSVGLMRHSQKFRRDAC